MKYLSKILLCTVAAAGSVTSCNTDQLKELNVNPQALKTINLNFLFTSVELGAASGGSAGDNRYIDWRTNIGMCSYAIQHLANAGGGIAPGDKYNEDNFETAEAPFQFMYTDQLKNIAEIFYQTSDAGYDPGGKPNMVAATRIMRAFLFHRLTDYYGSIPYFDALQARDKNYFPHYDKQKDVYLDLLKELDEATAALVSADATDGFAGADLIYKGDIAKWKKWGFSLMLRLGMRLSTIDPANANTYVAKAIAGGVFSSNTDNVIVPMAIAPSLWTNQNGISRAFFPGDGGQPTFLSKTMIDYLKGTDGSTTADDDPRLMIFTAGIGVQSPSGNDLLWAPTNTNPLQQKGMPNGKNQSLLDAFEGHAVDQNAEYSKINYLLLQRDEPYMLMNYGEVELLLAEAAERNIGGAAGGAVHYAAGVKASLQMYTIYDPSFTVSDATVASYLATYPYGVTKPALAMIGDQLWVNHFFNWWEAWSDYRRSGFPALTPVVFPGNITNGTIPARLKYPASESATNPNFAEGSTTPNNYMTKVWWAGGPE